MEAGRAPWLLEPQSVLEQADEQLLHDIKRNGARLIFYNRSRFVPHFLVARRIRKIVSRGGEIEDPPLRRRARKGREVDLPPLAVPVNWQEVRLQG